MHEKKAFGFTLIELMIVVAVVAILAAIAYPSYLDQVRKTRRADAQANLSGLGNAMERYFTQQNTYEGSASGELPAAPIAAVYASESPLDGDTKYYDLRIQTADASTYEIRAVPKGDQANDRCGTLTLTQTGLRGISDAAAGVTVDECWSR